MKLMRLHHLHLKALKSLKCHEKTWLFNLYTIRRHNGGNYSLDSNVDLTTSPQMRGPNGHLPTTLILHEAHK